MGKCKPRTRSLNHVFPPKRIALDHCNVLGMQERWKYQTISFWSTHSLKILVIWTWSLLRESVVAAEKLMHVFPARAKACLQRVLPQGPCAQEKSLSSIWHFISNGAKQIVSETFSFISSRLSWILSDKTALKRNRYQEEPGRPTRFCTPSQGVFVNFPGKRGMTLWLCDALCSKKICFWHDITRGAHLATGPGDCSCRLVLGTGPGDWFSWQSAKSVFAWILLCIYTFKKQPNSTQEWTKCPLFAGFSLTYCTFS